MATIPQIVLFSHPYSQQWEILFKMSFLLTWANPVLKKSGNIYSSSSLWYKRGAVNKPQPVHANLLLSRGFYWENTGFPAAERAETVKLTRRLTGEEVGQKLQNKNVVAQLRRHSSWGGLLAVCLHVNGQEELQRDSPSSCLFAGLTYMALRGKPGSPGMGKLVMPSVYISFSPWDLEVHWADNS